MSTDEGDDEVRRRALAQAAAIKRQFDEAVQRLAQHRGEMKTTASRRERLRRILGVEMNVGAPASELARGVVYCDRVALRRFIDKICKPTEAAGRRELELTIIRGGEFVLDELTAYGVALKVACAQGMVSAAELDAVIMWLKDVVLKHVRGMSPASPAIISTTVRGADR